MSLVTSILNDWMTILVILSSIFSLINIFLFIKLLNKFDTHQLNFMEYINQIGNERMLVHKKIDDINKKILTINRLFKDEKNRK